MSIRVFVDDVNKFARCINVKLTDTLSDFKTKFYEKYSVDLNNHRLTFKGNNLTKEKDEETLSELGIKTNSRILAVTRMHGGDIKNSLRSNM